VYPLTEKSHAMAGSQSRPDSAGASGGSSGALLNRLISTAHYAAAILGLGALALLAVRAVLRIETRWDAFAYHIPFAAKRAGLGVPYELPLLMQGRYDGFPPLPEFLQGLLWRVTGSLNATGTINILALALFLYYCHRKLKAPFSVVAILALTAPLAIIHAASNYVDLFANAFAAIGVTCLFAMMLFDRWTERSLLCWGLAGLTAAAWSKSVLLPVAAAGLLCFAAIYVWRIREPRSRQFLLLVFGAIVCSSIPYAKNLILYHNPIWPVQMPVWSHRFPYTYDSAAAHFDQTPAPLANLSQPGLFLHSVLEIGHPTEYPDRERWIIDQGNAWIAYRSGGYWNVAVVTAALAAVLLGLLWRPRKGWALAGALAAMWLFVSVLPQSHELRYYLFLPLTMAAVIGMLLPQARREYPAVTLVLMALFLGEFLWMAKVNHVYYRVERVDYRAAAERWGMTRWWPQLEPGQTYCAVAFDPSAFFLTGPTMREFHIIDRHARAECPPNVKVILAPGANR